MKSEFIFEQLNKSLAIAVQADNNDLAKEIMRKISQVIEYSTNIKA